MRQFLSISASFALGLIITAVVASTLEAVMTRQGPSGPVATSGLVTEYTTVRLPSRL